MIGHARVDLLPGELALRYGSVSCEYLANRPGKLVDEVVLRLFVTFLKVFLQRFRGFHLLLNFRFPVPNFPQAFDHSFEIINLRMDRGERFLQFAEFLPEFVEFRSYLASLVGLGLNRRFCLRFVRVSLIKRLLTSRNFCLGLFLLLFDKILGFKLIQGQAFQFEEQLTFFRIRPWYTTVISRKPLLCFFLLDFQRDFPALESREFLFGLGDC